MSAQQQFTKKPVTIEAAQMPLPYPEGVDASSDGYARNLAAADIYHWIESSIGSVVPADIDATPRSGVTIDPADGCLVIRTLEGDMKASPGDWIIRGVQGEFYPCKPEIFEATYERAQSGPLPGEATTGRGFRIFTEFDDLYGESFSVQASSLATQAAVWVGGGDARGHLSLDQARIVRAALSAFIDREESGS